MWGHTPRGGGGQELGRGGYTAVRVWQAQPRGEGHTHSHIPAHTHTHFLLNLSLWGPAVTDIMHFLAPLIWGLQHFGPCKVVRLLFSGSPAFRTPLMQLNHPRHAHMHIFSQVINECSHPLYALRAMFATLGRRGGGVKINYDNSLCVFVNFILGDPDFSFMSAVRTLLHSLKTQSTVGWPCAPFSLHFSHTFFYFKRGSKQLQIYTHAVDTKATLPLHQMI